MPEWASKIGTPLARSRDRVTYACQKAQGRLATRMPVSSAVRSGAHLGGGQVDGGVADEGVQAAAGGAEGVHELAHGLQRRQVQVQHREAALRQPLPLSHSAHS